MATTTGTQEYAVIGLRAFGVTLARQLQQAGKAVLGIDPEMRHVEAIVDELAQAVALDPSDPAALAQVDITSFDTVIIALAHDFELTTLTLATLKELGIRRVICEVETERQRNILLKVGADQVIQPFALAATQLAAELTDTRK